MLRHTLCFLLQDSLEQHVTIHVVLFFCKLTGAKCYDTRLCLLFFCKLTGAKVLRYAVVPLQRQTTGATCYDTCCPLFFSQPTGATCYETRCAFICSSKRAWSVTATSHVSCAGTLCFSRVQVTLRLCRTFPGFSAILEIRNSKLKPIVSKVTHSNLPTADNVVRIV